MNLSENHSKNDNTSSISPVNNKFPSDDLFAVGDERERQQPANDHWTDIFDPLYSRGISDVGHQQPCATLNCGNTPLLVQTVTTASSNNISHHSSNSAITTPRLTGFYGSSTGAVECTTKFTSFHGPHPQAYLSPQQVPPSNPTQGHHLPSNSVYRIFHSQSPSGASTTPLRLPKPSNQKSDFDFIGKSGRADAFSFVEDEMKASK